MDKYADVEAEAGEITSSQEHRLLHSSFIVVAQDRPSTSTPNVADPLRNAAPAPSVPHRRAVLKYPASSASEGRWSGKKKIRVLPKSTRGVRISCTDSHAEEDRGGDGDLGVSEGREPRRGGEGEDPWPSDPQAYLTTEEIREPEAAAREQPTVAQPSFATGEIREQGAASREHLGDPQPSLIAPEIMEPEAASREQPAEPQPSLTADEVREPGAASREHLADPQPSLTTPEIIEPEAASREQSADPQPSLTADATREPATASIARPADPEAMPTTDTTSKDPSLPADTNEGAGCSTEIPDEDDIPPLSLLDALRILTPDPRRILAETDVLEFLRSLGIDVPPPKGNGSVSGR
ncbi:uncharacterized protein LOC141841877 [Curcuma longa]|uniref:uncharacterized protein LOC141841877 n=1 Tax=Curcuma longa TaxID=136217 RepID=UPI003D9DF3C7